MGKKSGSGSGMNNPDIISESLETIFLVKILKFFDVDPESGMEKIRIRDRHPGSATLPENIRIAVLLNRNHNLLAGSGNIMHSGSVSEPGLDPDLNPEPDPTQNGIQKSKVRNLKMR
jgi:hypothetical protein